MKRIPISPNSHRAYAKLKTALGPMVAFRSFDMSRTVFMCPEHRLEKALRIRGVSRCRVKGKLFAAWGQHRVERLWAVVRQIRKGLGDE